MAQVSYGTITINDITDIADVYLEYALAISSANVTNNYTFNSLGEISWSTTYPTWSPGYQIWIREVQEKEGISQKEYKTPYLDTAVNQLNNNYINLNNRIKKIWSNSTGSYMASGINNNDVNENEVSTYGYNSKSTTTGISFNYNAIPLIEMGILDDGNFSGIKLYSPVLVNSIIGGSRLDATLTSWGLKLVKGGIYAGSYNSSATDTNQNFVYLSSEDYGISTKIGDSPSNKVDWRQIIGNKFGVDKAGNLYAAGAHIDGHIIAQSLTINNASSGDSYNAWDAINISGYSIEIIVLPYYNYFLTTDTTINSNKTYYTRTQQNGIYTYTAVNNPVIADIGQYYERQESETQVNLEPHLYHNGVEVVLTSTEYNNYLWYVNDDSQGSLSTGERGEYLGAYRTNRYRVTYAFNDGATAAGQAIQNIVVDPSKYITKINDTGIQIHPEVWQNNSSYLELKGTGLYIKDLNGSELANFTANGTQIGLSSQTHINISFGGLDLYKNSILVTHLGFDSNNNYPYFTFGDRVPGKEIGDYSFTAGEYLEATGTHSHAEGSGTAARGDMSHAEGGGTIAIGVSSHAEGYGSHSVGRFSHAEGSNTVANGQGSHAEGEHSLANGHYSHVSGLYTRAEADYQFVIGKYNQISSNDAFIIGNGTETTDRSNALTIDWNGQITRGDGVPYTAVQIERW